MEIVRDFDVDAYWNRKEDELNELPKCSFCGEPIQADEMIVTYNDEYCCPECEYERAREFWFDFARDDYVQKIQ